MKLGKILKNSFLVIAACLVLTACATTKKSTSQTHAHEQRSSASRRNCHRPLSLCCCSFLQGDAVIV